jgi:hypothetical protein
MEEEQIQEFVHRVAVDERMRRELVRNPARVIGRQHFSPRVARVIARLVPRLAFEQYVQGGDTWWHA